MSLDVFLNMAKDSAAWTEIGRIFISLILLKGCVSMMLPNDKIEKTFP